MKKRIVLYMLANLLVVSAVAQEFKVKLTKEDKAKKIMFSIGNSQVKIEGYDGDEIRIQAPGYKDASATASSKGLKALAPSSKTDNSGIGLSVLKTRDGVEITKVANMPTVYRILVPRQTAVSYKELGIDPGQIALSGVNGAIEVRATASDVDLSGVTGPLVINSTAGGDIKVSYAQSIQPSTISSIGGSVDVALPSQAKVTFQLKPVAGKVYTDFDIAMKNDSDPAMLPSQPSSSSQADNGRDFTKWVDDGERMEGTINGGGTEMALLGVDIYIRRQK